jgi:hypothetical protein
LRRKREPRKPTEGVAQALGKCNEIPGPRRVPVARMKIPHPSPHMSRSWEGEENVVAVLPGTAERTQSVRRAVSLKQLLPRGQPPPNQLPEEHLDLRWNSGPPDVLGRCGPPLAPVGHKPG